MAGTSRVNREVYARFCGRLEVKSLRPTRRFPAGSMGPKVDAACHFAEATGKRAAIGALKDLEGMLRGEAGTTITTAATAIELGV